MEKQNSIEFYELIIGIDPGTKTGIAGWCGNQFQFIKTLNQTQAEKLVIEMHQKGNNIFVILEDARKLGGFRSLRGASKMYGAGSIRRSCDKWIEIFEEYQIPFECVSPTRKGAIRKLDAKTFREITGWEGQTSEHARDAAMLVYQAKKRYMPELHEKKPDYKIAKIARNKNEIRKAFRGITNRN